MSKKKPTEQQRKKKEPKEKETRAHTEQKGNIEPETQHEKRKEATQSDEWEDE